MADSNYKNVGLLLPFSGVNNGTTFKDCSPSDATVTAYGNAKISTDQSKFGGSSGYFDGTGDYLKSTLLYPLGTSNFTFETWVYPVSLSSSPALISTFNTASSEQTGFYFYINSNGTVTFYTYNVAATSSATVPTGQWTHVALTRSGNTIDIYVGGTKGGQTTTSNNFSYLGVVISGNYQTPTGNILNGYLDDWRLTPNVVRYTANFTPPAASFCKTLSGTVKDDTNANAIRTVVAVPIDYLGRRSFYTDSASDGTWSIAVPEGPTYDVICMDDAAGTTYNDLIYGRVTPV